MNSRSYALYKLYLLNIYGYLLLLRLEAYTVFKTS